MKLRIDQQAVKRLALPARGNKVFWDGEHENAIPGFGLRLTASGARAFVFQYRTVTGRQRRMTIGSPPAWNATAAREEAKLLRRRVNRGEDPMGERHEARTAPAVNDLCDRFLEEHLPKKRPTYRRDCEGIIKRHVRPEIGKLTVAEVEFTDIDRLHRKITKHGSPYRANRTLSLLSKMFNLSIKWGMRERSSNPCQGVEKNPEFQRKRYLSPAEIMDLSNALASHDDQQAANIIRLLLFTGARRGQVSAMRWKHYDREEGTWAGVDLETGKWTKPAATTKQFGWHEVPLSPPALQLLAGLRQQAEKEAKMKGRDVSEYVFPGRHGGHRVEIKDSWAELCLVAGIFTEESEKDAKGRERLVKKPSARIHDLRHTTASIIASGGSSLPLIGAILGHTQAQTTLRYAHLYDAPQREAVDRVGAVVSGGKTAEIITLPTAKGAD